MTVGYSCALGAMNRVLACGDGPELLVYEGDGTPSWKQFCDDTLVGVGVHNSQVISVDGRGRVVRWNQGQRGSEATVNAEVRLTAFSALGEVALADDRTLYLPRGGEFFSVSIQGITGIAFDGTGQFVGAVTSTGQFTSIRLADGSVASQTSIPGGASSICWHQSGNWCVSTNGAIQLFGPDAKPSASIALAGDIQQLDSSKDGSLLVALIDGRSVVIVEMLGRSVLGQIDFKRRVTSVGFGGECVLGVGLEDGEASILDLSRGTAGRTEPHHGRGRTNWNFNSSVDSAQVRGIVARTKTAGGPVASFVYKNPKEGKKRSGCVTVLLVTLALSVVCSGCSGVAATVYYLMG